ncbi:MAG TPA: NAD(P)H-binding protein [Longimicrobiaceae bacterium]|nr:NAD(P)H-binding protein [Longimicrobiaceae bacterium]
MEARSALLLGATGLVGGHLLDLLLEDPAYGSVTTLGRRPVPREHPRLRQETVDFARLRDFAERIRAQDVFCSLGTTIRAAGSREAFRRVDLDYPRAVAEAAARNGAERFLLVSALGADTGSSLFYNRVKGEAEEAVRTLPFQEVVILRPALLLGERGEHRPGEELAQRLMPKLSRFLVGPLRKYRPVEARAVAAAMVRLAKAGGRGVRVVESDAIQALGGEILAREERWT